MIRVPMKDLSPGERDLDRAQARYLTRVHRLRPGDRFVAFDPEHAIECEGQVMSSSRVHLANPHAARVVAARETTWIHGCPKGDKADGIVRDATELGATRIVFVCTARVVTRPAEARLERWTRIAREAARQSGRGDAPEVLLATWAEALDGTTAATRVCLDPRGEPLRQVLADARGSLAFAAGPEGGLTDGEVAAATKHGFVTCRLGRLVMRTETAPAAVLGAAALFGE